MTRTLFTLEQLEPCRVRMSECDTLNEKNVRVCASCQVYCEHLPSRSRQLPLSGRETKRQLQINNWGFSVVGSLFKKCEDCGRVLMSDGLRCLGEHKMIHCSARCFNTFLNKYEIFTGFPTKVFNTQLPNQVPLKRLVYKPNSTTQP